MDPEEFADIVEGVDPVAIGELQTMLGEGATADQLRGWAARYRNAAARRSSPIPVAWADPADGGPSAHVAFGRPTRTAPAPAPAPAPVRRLTLTQEGLTDLQAKLGGRVPTPEEAASYAAFLDSARGRVIEGMTALRRNAPSLAGALGPVAAGGATVAEAAGRVRAGVESFLQPWQPPGAAASAPDDTAGRGAASGPLAPAAPGPGGVALPPVAPPAPMDWQVIPGSPPTDFVTGSSWSRNRANPQLLMEARAAQEAVNEAAAAEAAAIPASQEARVQGAQAEIDAEAAFQNSLRAEQAQYEKAAAEQRAQINASIDALLAAKTDVDPDRMWANKSTPARILTVLLAGIGGAGAAMAGMRTNPVLDAIDDAIRNDIEAQKHNIQQALAKGKLRLEGQQGILADLVRERGMSAETLQMAHAAGRKQVAALAEQIQARADTPLKVAQAARVVASLRAAGAVQIAELAREQSAGSVSRTMIPGAPPQLVGGRAPTTKEEAVAATSPIIAATGDPAQKMARMAESVAMQGKLPAAGGAGGAAADPVPVFGPLSDLDQWVARRAATAAQDPAGFEAAMRIYKKVKEAKEGGDDARLWRGAASSLDDLEASVRAAGLGQALAPSETLARLSQSAGRIRQAHTMATAGVVIALSGKQATDVERKMLRDALNPNIFYTDIPFHLRNMRTILQRYQPHMLGGAPGGGSPARFTKSGDAR